MPPRAKIKPPLSVEDAEAQHLAAVHKVADIEGRLRAGDPDLKPSELLDARNAVDYAVMRLEGARANQARATEEAKRERAAEIRKEIEVSLPPCVVEAAEAAQELEAAAKRLLEATHALETKKSGFRAVIRDLHSDNEPLPAYIKVLTTQVGHFTVGGAELRPFDPVRLALGALHVGFKASDAWSHSNPKTTKPVQEYAGPPVTELRTLKLLAAHFVQDPDRRGRDD